MYRKTLITLACAVISAPAFAQYVPPLSGEGLPSCELTNNRAPCSYLEWDHPRAPPNLFPPTINDPTPSIAPRSDGTAGDYDRSNPPEPSSPFDRWKNNHPTWNSGPGWQWGPGPSYPESHRYDDE
jgi:hypothetical protein